MSKSALGIIFSLLVVICTIPNAVAAGSAHSASTKKAPAKKAAVAKKKTKPVAVAKRSSASKKHIAQKSQTDSSPSKSKGSNKKVAIANRKHNAGFQPAAYTPMRPAGPSRRNVDDTATLILSQDPPTLGSSVVLVMDQKTSDVLFEKNAYSAMPIASITKLMTSLVVIESRQDMQELLTVTEEDIDREKNTYSRLRIGSQLTRASMLHIALMSSENRAASALGRHYPGGLRAFVAAMNTKAVALGMTDTRFVEPTGLSSNNVASARDLAKLVVAASRHPIIREYSTDIQYAVDPGGRTLYYKTSNHLVRNPEWEIGLQKTGYIAEAGRCLVMQATIEGRPTVMIFLDAKGTMTRSADAVRIRKWLEHTRPAVISRAVATVDG